ncbi:MAG: multiheme c-type cytochrome [Gemmataceae bacterium]
MHERIPGQSPASWSLTRVAAGLLAVICLAVATGWLWLARRPGGDQPSITTRPTQATVGNPIPPGNGVPFATWPHAQPELVLVLSGQTYGYLQPCGCSRPQKGGLERRANLMDQLRAKGWEVIGLDLGDAAPPKGVHKQNLLKYRTTMKALNAMGYRAIGLGEYEFSSQLFELLSEFTLNNPGKPPVILGADVAGAAERNAAGQVTKVFPREVYFPPGKPGDRPMVEAVEVIATPGKPAVGVVGVISQAVGEKVEKQDKQFAFLNHKDVLAAALKTLDAHPAKPELRVLLFAGKLDRAQEVAKAFPQFQVILCQSDDPEPPNFPTREGKTLILQVGHKGQNVGVLGVFRGPNGLDLQYQRVELGEEYLTPEGADAERHHKVLQLLEEYARDVRAQDLLKLHRAKPIPHVAQIQMPDAKLTFVGSEACKNCHPEVYKQYTETKHSHAFEALTKHAKRPGYRQFDGECVVCHTVGFEYVGGYENEKQTPHLLNVGCENCHGPGSGHAGNPFDPKLKARCSARGGPSRTTACRTWSSSRRWRPPN